MTAVRAANGMIVTGLLWFVVGVLTDGFPIAWWFAGVVWFACFVTWVYLGPIKGRWA